VGRIDSIPKDFLLMKAMISQTTCAEDLMVNVEQMFQILDALPDPAFLLSRSGKYLAVFGGKDARYYHDGSGLVGLYVADLVKPEMAKWFSEKIEEALQSKKLLIVEYKLGCEDIKGMHGNGPKKPIWFEGRINPLDFFINNEEVVLWVASNISARHDLEVKLRELSDKDELTDLFNRRKLEHDLARHYEEVSRYSVSTSLLIFDLDNFKDLNDTCGHHAGDDALIAVAKICQSQIRAIDIAYRFGGDEFVIILPNIDFETAIQFAQRLHKNINFELSFCCMGDITPTVSIGVSTLLATDQSYKAALKRADNALYEAKRNGKNKVMPFK
jgi:diguanylate cyclase (GGDEF)-like protein